MENQNKNIKQQRFNEKVDDNYYVDINEFSEGDYIVRKNSSNKYRIEETASLQGVYNINKGYAVFREVTVIAENEEYCIVADDDTFGLAQYDHIALGCGYGFRRSAVMILFTEKKIVEV